jgi:transcriptional regulator with XRE-family HTH domain
MENTSKRPKGSDFTKLIGRNVKSARIRQGLTQSKLAERLGLDNLTISRLETGVQMPSIERLNEIALALQVSVPILMTDPDKTDAFDGLLAAAVKDLPLREKEFVYAFAVQYAQHWRAGAEGKSTKRKRTT